MKEGRASRHYTSVQDFQVHVLPSLPEIKRILDVPVVLRDGTLLSANCYLPASGLPVPVICSMTPYRKERHKECYDNFSNIDNTHLGIMRFSCDATFEGPDPGFWVPHGYGVVHVDARGFGKSPGLAKPFSTGAFRDFYDTIEWVAAQPWCNGRVATSGVSYLGLSQYFLAALHPPSLCAINPWDARTDRFRSDFLGGIPNTYMSRWVFENFTIPSLNDPSQADDLRAFADTAGAPRLLSDPYYAEQKELLSFITRVNVPTLIGGSISDQAKHTRDAFENFMAIESAHKWLYIHRDPEWAAYYDEAGLAIQRRFFDHFVKGIDNGWEDTPKVFGKIFQNRTRFGLLHGAAWPLPQTVHKTFYLGNSQSLLSHEQSSEASESYNCEKGRVTFSIVFDRDVSIVGHSHLTIWLSTEGSEDADLFVGLKKFDCDGDEVYFLGESGNNPNDIVSRGWLRASHRELSEASTSFRPLLSHTRQLPLLAKEPTKMTIEIHPTSTSFRAGETLTLVIQGASIQPSDVAIGFDEKINKGVHTVHFGGIYKSYLSLPMV